MLLTGKGGETWTTFPGEAVDSVRQAITHIMRTESFPKKLVVLSAMRQEGVTYLSRAIGTVLANDFGRKTCVLELNWWWPADYPKIVVGRPGIAEVLLGDIPLEEAFIPTGLDNLTLIPAGKQAHKLRSNFTKNEELLNVLTTLQNQFDHIILDLPAVTATSDAILLASLGTAVSLVIRQGVTPVQRVKATLDDLDHLNITGVIMNQVSVATPSYLLEYIVQE